MLPITLRQIQVFESVARHLSHSRAASELYLSQPAISMQIKQVEETCGLTLLESANKKLFLTEAGREMLHYSRSILQQIKDLEAALDEMKGLERGQLSIAVVSTANYFMAQLLAEFIQTHPGIQVSLHVANRDSVLLQLTDNLANFAIMGLPTGNSEMDAHPFMENPLVIIASPTHPLATRSHISPAELARETFVLRERGSGTRRVIERYFDQHNLPMPRSMEMDSNEAIKQCVQAGIGLGIISRHAIELKLETARLHVLDVEGFPIIRDWYIVHRKNKRLSLAAQAFKQFLMTKVAELTSLAKIS